MARHNRANAHAIAHPMYSRTGTALADRLNKQVLQTLVDLKTHKTEPDPGIEDEYEFEIFGNTGPVKVKKKK